MNLHQIKLLIIILFSTNIIFAQYHTPIQNFTPDLYQAGDQNWKISQDDYNRVYVANNFGLLTYNGTNWKLHPTPNNTIMRSVFANSNAVYTGSYMDFGYWLRQSDGQLKYTSLVKSLNFEMIEDEQVWNILPHKQFVIFQSLHRLIIYDQIKRKLSTFNPVSGILKVFITSGNIYYQDNNLSLYKIENEKSQIFISANDLRKNYIVGISDTAKGILLVTRDSGLFTFNNKLASLNNSLNNILAGDVIFSFTQTKSELVLGSVKNGVYILSSEGELIRHISSEEGLVNSTVLSVFSDKGNGVWLGLDNGLSYIPLVSPMLLHNANQQPVGTVYTTKIFENNLYIGTNQGLYYKSFASTEKLMPVNGLEGQVWTLQIVNDALLCGHDKGAFVINKNKAKPLFTKSGVWRFKQINNNQLIAGTYNGLHIFEHNNSYWNYQKPLENFQMSSRYFEFINEKEILVSHEYKGVFKLALDATRQSVVDVMQIPKVNASLYSSMVLFQGRICYFSNQGFFEFDEETKHFVRNDMVSALFTDSNFTSGKMVVDRDKYLWLFERNNLIRLEKAALSDAYVVNKYPLSYEIRKTNTGFENISHVALNEYLIGTSNGFFVFDTSKIITYSPNIVMSKLEASSKNSEQITLNLDNEVKLPARFNSIAATYFLSNNQIGDKVLFQYKLEGYSDNWTDWSERATVAYSNLKFGTYTLSARAMVSDVISETDFELSFKISRPWYFSSTALLVYVAFMVLLFRIVNSRYSKYYRTEQEKLIDENKRKINLMTLKQNEEIMRIKNEQLQDNIEQKNKELAISTMAMIKKNQFMNALLNDLEPAAKDPIVARVIRIIKRSLKNDDDWEFFEQAFDNADKDFLKRLKEIHSSLTNHDLKLCAYLRLNLSSKEIAPLLNISVKSVDIKRYRLRKKMDLDHDQNLTEYILSL